MNQKGRIMIIHHTGQPPLSVLLKLLKIYSLHTIPALLILSSCARPSDTAAPDQAVIEEETVQLTSQFETECGGKDIRVCDIFIYSASGTCELETHIKTERPDTVELSLKEGDKTAVVIANCPYEFNVSALSRIDSMELVRMSFSDDDPGCPVMSGTAEFRAGRLCLVEIAPLMCTIRLVEVVNNMDGYRCLEDPRVGLMNTNTSAELIRASGFRPVEIDTDAHYESLPCDVGMFPQHPGTELFCYPNDSTVPTAGTPATSIIFECSIDGEKQVYSYQLPPMGRNSRISLTLTVDAPGKYTFSWY